MERESFKNEDVADIIDDQVGGGQIVSFVTAEGAVSGKDEDKRNSECSGG